MAESRAKAKAAEDVGELDEIADELYALRADAFAAARDERVRIARAEGRAALARELNKLRKPTQSAWLINLLWRDQRDVMQQLFKLADELSGAQAAASWPELHRLTAQRRELEAALIRRARALAEKAGVSVSASMEREAQETLAAALARPDVAEEVRTGRLVKPATYAGFGFGTLAASAPPSGAHGLGAEDSAPKEPAPKPADFEAHVAKRARAGVEEEERRAEAERHAEAERRAAAERRVAEARMAAETAADALADHARAVDAVHAHQREVRQRLEELQQQLRDLEAEVASADGAVAAAEHHRDQAEKAEAAARRTLAQAEQHLKESVKAS